MQVSPIFYVQPTIFLQLMTDVLLSTYTEYKF